MEALGHSPPINLIKKFLPAGLTMCLDKVLAHPHHKMVLECTLDELVEEVAQEELVYVRLRKSCSERLQCIRMKGMQRDTHLYIQ